MKNKVKVLQLASFEGNIGDNANHRGARRKLEENLSFQFSYTNLEIREFYWGIKRFDNSFIEYVNQFDLFMIGGGNYFELWVDKSSTGTSIDIAPDLLSLIKCPILFYALGVDIGQGTNQININKFTNFLNVALKDGKSFVSVRNDGSFQTLRNLVSDTILSQVTLIPDGGFFTKPLKVMHPELPVNKKIITINLAGDMIDKRFDSSKSLISYAQFCQSFAHFCESILRYDTKIHLVFVPHIYKDIAIIYDVLREIDDRLNRKCITIASYFSGESAHDYIFDIYRNSDLVLGNRFHANVCGIGLNIPTIGLINYPQIKFLYEELKLESYCVEINKNGFEKILFNKVINALNESSKLKELIKNTIAKLDADILRAHVKVNSWLTKVLN